MTEDEIAEVADAFRCALNGDVEPTRTLRTGDVVTEAAIGLLSTLRREGHRVNRDHDNRIYVDDLTADQCFLISSLESELLALIRSGY